MIGKSIKINKTFFGEKSAIVAKSGYGKSYTARVIVEDGRELGVCFTIIDPQEAYLNLPDFDYINAHQIKNAKGLGILLAQTNRNVVISTKGLGIEDQQKIVKEVLEEYRKYIRKGIQCIVIDEMHKFAPETEKAESKDTIRAMFQENRSDGLGIIGITQRPARMDKTCLSQADNLIIGRVTSFRDKEAVKNYLDNVDDIESIAKLEKGEFYFCMSALDAPHTDQVRKSVTTHSGNSPQHLLNEQRDEYHKLKRRFVRMENSAAQANNIANVAGIQVPGPASVLKMGLNGMKITAGFAVGRFAGSYLGNKIPIKLPFVSPTTLGSTITTAALYAGYRLTPGNIKIAKDVMEYATYGAAAHWVGSVAFDILNAVGVRVPDVFANVLSMTTGAGSAPAGNAESSSVDTNTIFR